MKKLFSKSKTSKDGGASSSAKGSGGYYDVKEKSLTKIYKAAWCGDHKKLSSFHQDVNTPDAENRTALHLASYRGHDKVVSALLAAGAKADTPDREGRSPLYRAVQLSRLQCARLLLEAGAVKRDDEALVLAMDTGSAEMLRMLLDKWRPSSLGSIAGKSLLHLAVTNGNAELLSLLLGRTSDPDEAGPDGQTALMLACQEGHVDLTKLLLKAGADPALKDASGRSSADYARGHAMCVQVLETHAASGQQAKATAVASRPRTSSDYEDDGSKSTDYAIPMLDSGRSEKSVSDHNSRRSISLNDIQGRGRVEIYDPDTQKTRSLKVPIIRDNRRRSRSPSPAVSASLDSGSEDDVELKARLTQRSESAKASLAAVPETVASASAVKKSPADGDDDDDDDDWSASISVDKEPPKLNLKLAMETRKQQGGRAAAADDYDDDTVASDFPPTLTPRSGGRPTPRDRQQQQQQHPVFQRQESDWDASEISEVAVPASAGGAKPPAKPAKDAEDEDAESDWDDSVAVPSAAPGQVQRKPQQPGPAEADSSDSDWDGSEATAPTRRKDSANDASATDWDTSTEAAAEGTSPRKRPPPPRPPPPPPPRQQQQPQQQPAELVRRQSRNDKDSLQPIEEEAGDTPSSRRKANSRPPSDGGSVEAARAQHDREDAGPRPTDDDFDKDDDFHSQRKEEADKVIAMLQAGDFGDAESPTPAKAAGSADANSSLSDDDEDASLPQAVAKEVARLQLELAASAEQLAASRAAAGHSEAARSRLAEELEEARRKVAEAAEDASDTRRRLEVQRQQCAELQAQLNSQLVGQEALEAEARTLRTDLDFAQQRQRAVEQSEADARAGLEQERLAREEAESRLRAAAAAAVSATDEEAAQELLREAEQERRRADAAERQAAEARAEAESLRGRMRAQEARWADERERLEAQAAEDEATSREALAKMALGLEAARAEAGELRHRLEAERQEAGQLRARLAALTESAGQGDRQVSELAGQLHQVREANIRLEEQLASERTRTSAGQDELGRAIGASKEAGEEATRLRAELARCQAELRDTRADARRLKDAEAALAAAEGRLAGVGQANADLREQLQRLLAAASRGDEKESQLQQRLCDILSGYRDDFDKTKVELEKEKIGLQFEANALKAEVSSLRGELGTVKSEVASLRASGDRPGSGRASADPDAAAAIASGTQKMMPSWRADEYEERIRHQEVRNAKLEMSLDFEQKKVRGLMKDLDSVNEMSVDELRRACLDVSSERDRFSSDCQHYRQLYDREKRLRQKLTDELERLNNSEAHAAAALSIERERSRMHSTSQSLLQQQQYGVYASHQSLASPLQPDPLLQQKLRSELDRSISKHLESEDFTRFYASRARSNGNLSKAGAETDQSYLNYLKKKYLV